MISSWERLTSQYGRMSAAQRAAAFEKASTCPYCGEAPSTQVDHINALKQDWESGGWADDFATRTARVNDPDNFLHHEALLRIRLGHPVIILR